MQIIVRLELSSPYKNYPARINPTAEEIENDLRMSEDSIGWNYDYVIKSVEVKSQKDTLSEEV